MSIDPKLQKRNRTSRRSVHRVPKHQPELVIRGPSSDIVVATFRLFAGSAAAFLIMFPTVGYYTLATYSNALFSEESNIGGILIRGASLIILFIAWISVPTNKKRRFRGLLIPATAFVMIYSWRLFDNIVIQGINLSPGNAIICSVFFMSSIIPAYMIASMEKTIYSSDMITLLSLYVVLFMVGMALNREALLATSDQRMLLTKVNPIALAYVASSFLLYYLLSAKRSRRSAVEALIVVPVLLIVVSLARSRGMIISTGVAIVFYVVALKGTRRVWNLMAFGAIVIAVTLFAKPEYFNHVIEALGRINEDTDMSTAMRALSFRGAWEQFLANPIAGRYAIELQTGVYPHNIFLESLMAVGLLGTIPFAVHLCMAFRAAFGLLREPNSPFVCMFVALLFVRDFIGSLASGGIWGVSGFWITSFLVLVMWYGRERDQRNTYYDWRSPRTQSR